MKFAVVTTFHNDGYKKYGRRMIETFLKNWPKEVTLYVYAEDCLVTESAPNLIVKDLIESSPELKSFKTIWKEVPKANGWCKDSTQKFKDKNQKIGFKWDAVRFAHKVYSIFACAEECDSDMLVWMDADTVCHSPISMKDIERLCPADRDICFLGRRGKYTECGLYAMNLRKPATQMFLKRFQQYYDDAENGIFKLDEWHDSFVFDAVRKTMAMNELDWSSHLISGEGHPLINSNWGAWLDHLKGGRKDQGRSPAKDLKVKRTEAYWS